MRASAGAQASSVVPEEILTSPLMKKGGFQINDRMLTESHLQLLLAEAAASWSTAVFSDVPVSQGGEWRGGSPARRFLSAPGGSIQTQLYHAQGMMQLLRETTGLRMLPSGALGTYTYYAAEGHHLAVHRDVESCDLAVITCIFDKLASRRQGVALTLYPDRIFEPISTIGRSANLGALQVTLRPGQTIILLGGVIPHAVLPLKRGQSRVVSVLCYRASDIPRASGAIRVSSRWA